MSQSDLAEFETDRRAESALELLRSLAKAGEDPDTFAQACIDWSRLEKDATAVPDFMTVLGLMSEERNQTDDGQRSESLHHEIFRFDPDGTIVSMSNELSSHLGLSVGQSIAGHLSRLEDPHLVGQAILITLPDSFGIDRHVRVFPIAPNGQVTGYLARAVLSRFRPHVHAHLHHQYGLTKSEIQILELVLKRHSLEQVAAIRNSTLNTVRTHIARLIHKLGCHSLVEAVATALEIANALSAPPPSQHVFVPTQEDVHQAEQRLVGKSQHVVEYRRYGALNGRPVMILHSLEYGYAPSDLMIERAKARGLTLIFPIRPGFGATPRGATTKEAAEIIKALIEALELSDVTLIGLSFAGPLALAVQDQNPRVARTGLINYGLNAKDKMKNIHPRWVRGMLRMGLSSPASFSFGANTALSMIKTFGGLRFFRTVYRQQESDQKFVEANKLLFELSADYIAKADKETLRAEIQSALLPNPEIDRQIARATALTAMISSDQNGVGFEETKADAKRLGLTFRTIEHTGRNWLFQHPDTLFDEMIGPVVTVPQPVH